MKECLECKKEFKPKSGKAKFCSSYCRLAHFRKVGKKGEIKEYQIKELYDSMMEAVEKLTSIRSEKGGIAIPQKDGKMKVYNYQPITKESHDGSKVDYPTHDEISFSRTSKPERIKGEDPIDYAGRVNEWKKTLNK